MATPIGDRENGIDISFNSPLTRRVLLGLVAQALVLVGLGGFIHLFNGKGRFLRPPGALPEREFLSRCIKCQKCQEVCPTDAITPVLVTEDIAGVGTPRLAFHQGYCDLCMKCVEICPTGALEPIKKESVRLGVAQVDRQRCVAWVWRGCTRCQQLCPLDAIVLDDNQRPIVESSKCNGCGLCAYICLNTSLRSHTSASGKGIVVVPLDAAGSRDFSHG